MRRFAIALTLATLAATGCGDDGRESSRSPTSVTETSRERAVPWQPLERAPVLDELGLPDLTSGPSRVEFSTGFESLASLEARSS